MIWILYRKGIYFQKAGKQVEHLQQKRRVNSLQKVFNYSELFVTDTNYSSQTPRRNSHVCEY